jgi:hypothetical protein
MDFLTSCSGCKQALTLPVSDLGQQVQCPNCSLEFAAFPSAAPSMEVEPSASAGVPVQERRMDDKPSLQMPAAPLQTAYMPRDDRSSAVGASFYCILCGTRVAPTDETCPNCGCPIQTRREDDFRPRRHSRPRSMQPVRGLFAFLGTILIPIGLLFIIGAPIADEILRRNPLRNVMPFLLVFFGIAVEVAALVLCVVWLYQAWRAVAHEDEEYSPV